MAGLQPAPCVSLQHPVLHFSRESELSLMTSNLVPEIKGPLPDVVTARLDLRRFEPNDLYELAGVFAQPEVWQFPFGRGFTLAETTSFLDSQIRASMLLQRNPN